MKNKWKTAFFVTAGWLVVNNLGAWYGARSFTEAGRIYQDTIEKLDRTLAAVDAENTRLKTENHLLKNQS